MGRFDVSLLDTDRLFNVLVREITPAHADVIGELSVGTFGQIPAVMYYATAMQDGNANGLWSVTLTLNVFDDPRTAWDLTTAVYSGLYGWQDPTKGIVPNVGAIESLDQEISAFGRIGGEAQMENKSVIQYTGSWQFTARSN